MCKLCSSETKANVVFCNVCVQTLLNFSDEQIYTLMKGLTEAAEGLKRPSLLNKVAIIEKFTGLSQEGKEADAERKAKSSRSNLVRERPSRQARRTHH